MKFENIKIGDTVTRLLGGKVPMQLRVSKVTEDLIECGPWKFLKATGGEVDEDLGWDGYNTGSILQEMKRNEICKL
jgi:phage-related minor tail protein